MKPNVSFCSARLLTPCQYVPLVPFVCFHSLIESGLLPFQPCGMPAATMVLEDAVFLGTLFSHIRHPSQIPTLLYAYEDVRRPRASALHALELANLSILHLPPGPERKARDEVWKEQKKAFMRRLDGIGGDEGVDGDQGSGSEDETRSEAENQEMRRQWQELFEVWEYDAREAAESWWIEWGILGERAMEMHSYANDSTTNSSDDGRLGFQQMEVVVRHG